VRPLGDSDGAALLREKLIAKLTTTDRFQVVDSPDRADAEIVGRGEMTKGERAAVFRGMAVGRTVYDTVLVVRLMDKQKNVLWAYDSAEDSKDEGAVKSLLKAIDKESKSKPKRPK
jgi:hypothetical protein